MDRSKQRVFQVSIGDEQSPVSFSFGSSMEITLNASSIKGRRSSESNKKGTTWPTYSSKKATAKYPNEQYKTSLPEKTSQFSTNVLPFMMQSTNMEHFRAAFFPSASEHSFSLDETKDTEEDYSMYGSLLAHGRRLIREHEEYIKNFRKHIENLKRSRDKRKSDKEKDSSISKSKVINRTGASDEGFEESSANMPSRTKDQESRRSKTEGKHDKDSGIGTESGLHEESENQDRAVSGRASENLLSKVHSLEKALKRDDQGFDNTNVSFQEKEKAVYLLKRCQSMENLLNAIPPDESTPNGINEEPKSKDQSAQSTRRNLNDQSTSRDKNVQSTSRDETTQSSRSDRYDNPSESTSQNEVSSISEQKSDPAESLMALLVENMKKSKEILREVCKVDEKLDHMQKKCLEEVETLHHEQLSLMDSLSRALDVTVESYNSDGTTKTNYEEEETEGDKPDSKIDSAQDKSSGSSSSEVYIDSEEWMQRNVYVPPRKSSSDEASNNSHSSRNLNHETHPNTQGKYMDVDSKSRNKPIEKSEEKLDDQQTEINFSKLELIEGSLDDTSDSSQGNTDSRQRLIHTREADTNEQSENGNQPLKVEKKSLDGSSGSSKGNEGSSQRSINTREEKPNEQPRSSGQQVEEKSLDASLKGSKFTSNGTMPTRSVSKSKSSSNHFSSNPRSINSSGVDSNIQSDTQRTHSGYRKKDSSMDSNSKKKSFKGTCTSSSHTSSSDSSGGLSSNCTCGHKKSKEYVCKTIIAQTLKRYPSKMFFNTLVGSILPFPGLIQGMFSTEEDSRQPHRQSDLSNEFSGRSSAGLTGFEFSASDTMPVLSTSTSTSTEENTGQRESNASSHGYSASSHTTPQRVGDENLSFHSSGEFEDMSMLTYHSSPFENLVAANTQLKAIYNERNSQLHQENNRSKTESNMELVNNDQQIHSRNRRRVSYTDSQQRIINGNENQASKSHYNSQNNSIQSFGPFAEPTRRKLNFETTSYEDEENGFISQDRTSESRRSVPDQVHKEYSSFDFSDKFGPRYTHAHHSVSSDKTPSSTHSLPSEEFSSLRQRNPDQSQRSRHYPQDRFRSLSSISGSPRRDQNIEETSYDNQKEKSKERYIQDSRNVLESTRYDQFKEPISQDDQSKRKRGSSKIESEQEPARGSKSSENERREPRSGSEENYNRVESQYPRSNEDNRTESLTKEKELANQAGQSKEKSREVSSASQSGRGMEENSLIRHSSKIECNTYMCTDPKHYNYFRFEDYEDRSEIGNKSSSGEYSSRDDDESKRGILSSSREMLLSASNENKKEGRKKGRYEEIPEGTGRRAGGGTRSFEYKPFDEEASDRGSMSRSRKDSSRHDGESNRGLLSSSKEKSESSTNGNEKNQENTQEVIDEKISEGSRGTLNRRTQSFQYNPLDEDTSERSSSNRSREYSSRHDGESERGLLSSSGEKFDSSTSGKENKKESRPKGRYEEIPETTGRRAGGGTRSFEYKPFDEEESDTGNTSRSGKDSSRHDGESKRGLLSSSSEESESSTNEKEKPQENTQKLIDENISEGSHGTLNRRKQSFQYYPLDEDTSGRSSRSGSREYSSRHDGESERGLLSWSGEKFDSSSNSKERNQESRQKEGDEKGVLDTDAKFRGSTRSFQDCNCTGSCTEPNHYGFTRKTVMKKLREYSDFNPEILTYKDKNMSATVSKAERKNWPIEINGKKPNSKNESLRETSKQPPENESSSLTSEQTPEKEPSEQFEEDETLSDSSEESQGFPYESAPKHEKIYKIEIIKTVTNVPVTGNADRRGSQASPDEKGSNRDQSKSSEITLEEDLRTPSKYLSEKERSEKYVEAKNNQEPSQRSAESTISERPNESQETSKEADKRVESSENASKTSENPKGSNISGTSSSKPFLDEDNTKTKEEKDTDKSSLSKESSEKNTVSPDQTTPKKENRGFGNLWNLSPIQSLSSKEKPSEKK